MLWFLLAALAQQGTAAMDDKQNQEDRASVEALIDGLPPEPEPTPPADGGDNPTESGGHGPTVPTKPPVQQ